MLATPPAAAATVPRSTDSTAVTTFLSVKKAYWPLTLIPPIGTTMMNAAETDSRYASVSLPAYCIDNLAVGVPTQEK